RVRVLRLHHDAGVAGDPVVVHLDLAGLAIERDLGDAGAERLVVLRESDAEGAILAPRLLPVRHLGHRLDHRLSARMVPGQLETNRERILAGGMRDLIEEALGDELVVARADAAPGVHAHAALLAHRLGEHVRYAVLLLEAAPADDVLASGRLEARR